MKVVVDTLGGDYAPFEIIKGSVAAQAKHKNLTIILCGEVDQINKILTNFKYDKSRCEIISAPDIISNDDVPTVAIKEKANSSLAVAFDVLKKDEDVIGLVSAGSTGAILAGGFLKIGRIKGVSRPMLCPFLPTKNGDFVLVADCGANVDCKPLNLCHFAVMANEYYKERFGKKNPRIALLNIGTEQHKGNELSKEVYKLFNKLNLNFVGNMEARDIMSGNYDVVIADGFSGNIALKATEGALKIMMGEIKKNISKSFFSKIGALFMFKVFKKLKKDFDFNSYGGSPFLGCKKLIIKSHGSSKAKAIELSIDEIITLKNKDFNKQIEKAIGDIPNFND